MENSTLSSNQAYNGGGIGNFGTMIVSGSTLSGNWAHLAGGGIVNFGTLLVVSSTIAENAAATDGLGDGGGIASMIPASTTLQNTMVAGNTRGSVPEWDDLGAMVEPTSSYNLVGHAASSGGLQDGVNGNLVGVEDTSWLAPLGDYGGPTRTHALLPGSPAIDAGNNALAIAPDGGSLDYDQRGPGFPRIVYATVDIGAVELQNLPPEMADQAFHVAENQPAGMVIGTLAASDVDIGQALTFALVACDPSCPLALNATTGELTVADPAFFNHEMTALFTVTVTVTDDLDGVDTAEITVHVDDVNDQPSFIDVQNRVVLENLAGVVVGPVRIEDEDVLDTHSIAVSDTRFDIVDGQLMLKQDQFLAAATEPTVTIQLTVTDSGQPPLSREATFEITVQPNPFPWHNAALPEDIDGDGVVKPLDALRAINDYNLYDVRELGPRPARPGQTPLFLDVVGDAFFTPQDIHQIVNFLNAAVASAAEGEAYAAA